MPIRKALFSKPAWAAKSPEPFEDDQPASIFQQNVYEDILQEKRRKEERKAAKEKERAQKSGRNTSESRETRSDNDRTVKKRRISTASIEPEDDDEDDDFDEAGAGSDSDHASARSEQNRRRRTPPVQRETNEGTSRTTRGTAKAQSDESRTASPQETRTNVINLGSDDDDDELVIYDSAPVPTVPVPAQAKQKSKPKPPPPPESETDSDPEEDEYVKALKRKAREEARAKNREAAATHLTTNPSSNSGLSLDPNPTSTSTATEPQVHIYINSILPNCPPIGIIRRPSQTLESVHTHFCETHKLGDLLRSKVFFTWNNQRLFKSTTTKSILDQIKRKHGGIDKSEGKIVLEAVTEEILEYRLQQKEKARKCAEEGEDEEDGAANNENNETNGGLPPVTDAAGIPVPVNGNDNQPALPAGVIIKLNSATPDLPSMNLRVHAHTTVDKIVRGYKKRMNLDMAKPVYLVFEGDRLEGESTVGDVGFEDGDCVDVRCK